MNTTIVIKKGLSSSLFLLSSLLFVSLFSFSVLAAGTALCTDPATQDDCYQENPTYANLIMIAEPTQEQFDLLLSTNSQQAAFYLMSRYDTEFASSYIEQTDLGSVDATGAAVAERYFSESPSNVEEHKNEFQQYLNSKGITISLVGDISAYKSDGTIVADNGQINVKNFGSKYTFVVNAADELVLIPKGSTKQYEFEGTVTKGPEGDLRITGVGSFDGMDVTNAQYIRVDSSGNTLIGAQQYGDLRCKTLCRMVYNPSEQTYQFKDAILVDYPDFKLTGTLRPDEAYYGLSTTYTIPAGKKLEVQPIVSDPSQQGIADQGYRVLANGGKDVEIALEDDTWLDHPADFVLQYIGETAVSVGLVSEETLTSATESFEETYQEAVEAGVAPETKKDKVRLDSEGTVYLESTDAAADDPASYRMEVDMGAMYTAEQQETQVAEYIPVPEKGFFEAGDYAKAGTDDYDAVTQIQTIVGAKPDGKYGPKTGKAVSTWENEYNEDFALTPEMPEYLDPDGTWDERNTYAYLRMTKQLEDTSALAMDMRGGEASIDLSSGGFDIVQTGAMDIEVEGVVFKYDAQGNTDKELQQVVKNDISIPITITSCTSASSSSSVAGAAIEPVAAGANCYKFSSTETAYGLGSLSEGFASGRIAASCPLALGMYDTSSAGCASHVTALAEIEGGRYNVYIGLSKTIIGFEYQDFATATGQTGDAWTMPANMIRASGKEKFFKESAGLYEFGDPRLAEPVAYDQRNLEIGDNIFMYNTQSHYLEQANAETHGTSKATHVVKVVAKPHVSYTYIGDSSSATDFLRESLEIPQELDSDGAYLSGYPVWINSERAVYSNGDFYYADARGNPTGNAITLKKGDKVDTQKTLINQQVVGTGIIQVDYGYFLSQNSQFSLYRVITPSPKKYEEVEEKSAGSVRVEVYTFEDVETALAAQGIPNSQMGTAVEYVKQLNNLPADGFSPGDVLMIPSAQNFQERYATSLQQRMEENGISNSPEIVRALETSTKERAREYNIPESEIPDLMEATAEIAYYEKGLIPPEDWSLHPFRDENAPEGWKDSYEHEFAREQYAAWVEQKTGLVPDRVSYGYLDTQSEIAQRNAEDLAAAGVIDEVDYTSPEDMLTYEGSFTHGGREIAKLWGRYADPDRPYEENLAIVGLGYNRGHDAPMLMTVQKQMTEVGYPLEHRDGIYGDETLTAFETFAKDNGVSFDKDEAQRQIDDGTFNLEKTPVYAAIKESYKQKTGKEPAYVTPPTADGFVYKSDENSWDLMDICAILTPTKDRCAVQNDQS